MNCLVDWIKHVKATMKQTNRVTYLMDSVVGVDVVSPKISPVWKKVPEVLLIQAPMSELRVRDTEARQVAADMLEEITER